MSNWKSYLWDEVNSRDLLLSDPLRITDPNDLQQAEFVGLDPNQAYLSRLKLKWRMHPAGVRVLIDADHIAIEVAMHR